MTRLLGLAAALRDPCGELPAHQPLLPPAQLRHAGGEVCSCLTSMCATVRMREQGRESGTGSGRPGLLS